MSCHQHVWKWSLMRPHLTRQLGSHSLTEVDQRWGSFRIWLFHRNYTDIQTVSAELNHASLHLLHNFNVWLEFLLTLTTLRGCIMAALPLFNNLGVRTRYSLKLDIRVCIFFLPHSSCLLAFTTINVMVHISTILNIDHFQCTQTNGCVDGTWHSGVWLQEFKTYQGGNNRPLAWAPC